VDFFGIEFNTATSRVSGPKRIPTVSLSAWKLWLFYEPFNRYVQIYHFKTVHYPHGLLFVEIMV